MAHESTQRYFVDRVHGDWNVWDRQIFCSSQIARLNMAIKKRTNEEIADELTSIVVEKLDKLSPEEREGRIQAFEKRVATSRRRSSGSKGSLSAAGWDTEMGDDSLINFIYHHRFCAGGFCRCGFDLHGSANSKVLQWKQHVAERIAALRADTKGGAQ